ncbi:CoA transferase [Rhodococcus olei]|uniref:CoA transferase n=1 Tax=Rhodococcus olei TaxID=2161675 RepID=A0ABP8PVC7_9NOCA
MTIDHAAPPLQGIRVVQFAHGVMPAYAGMLLGDLGAEVIEISDHSASSVERGEFAQHATLSALGRNKRRVSLDLDTPAGRDIARRLIGRSDAVINGSESGWAVRRDDYVGDGVEPCVWCDLSPFGGGATDMGSVASDLVIQARSSAMDTTGELNRPPVRMGLPLPSLLGGVHAVAGVLAALLADRPARLSVSAFDAMVSFISYMGPTYLHTGQVPRRMGTGHHEIYPYNAFETRDGSIVVAPFTQSFWRKYCDVIGHPELLEDPRFSTFELRMKNRPVLSPILAETMRERTTQQWRDLLDAGDVPNGPVNSVLAALEMEQSRIRDMVAPIDIEGEQGTRRTVGTPFHMTFENGAAFEPRYVLRKTELSNDVATLDAWNTSTEIGAPTRVGALAGERTEQ